MKVFREDWQLAETIKEQARTDEKAPAEKVAKKLAKAVAKELPPVAPVLEETHQAYGSREDGARSDSR